MRQPRRGMGACAILHGAGMTQLVLPRLRVLVALLRRCGLRSATLPPLLDLPRHRFGGSIRCHGRAHVLGAADVDEDPMRAVLMAEGRYGTPEPMPVARG